MIPLKIHIARFLIVFGFMLNLSNYALELVDFFKEDVTSISYTSDSAEDHSESKEKDTEDKSELKEKDKISQFSDDKISGLSILILKYYPEFSFNNTSVYLEHTTEPPEFS